MKERPILFSAPMVRALLAGRKTQTRRVVKPQPYLYHDAGRFKQWMWDAGKEGLKPFSTGGIDDDCWDFWKVFCPHGTIGDRLWVRETFFDNNSQGYSDGLNTVPAERDMEQVFYRATDPNPDFEGETIEHDGGGWRPSIHMPRWASRLTLEITGVRVERVQDIREADARAEGMQPNWVGDLAQFDPDEHGYLPFDADDEGNVPACDVYETFTARDCFARLWDSINGKRPGCSWEANPWMWVLEFRRVEGEGS